VASFLAVKHCAFIVFLVMCTVCRLCRLQCFEQKWYCTLAIFRTGYWV